MANYPKTWNKWYKNVGRQLYCFFLGHKWKSSWKRRVEYRELIKQDYMSLPYTHRESGNPYWEWSASWKHKCHRCRLSTSGNVWNPWWKDLYTGLFFSIDSTWGGFKFFKDESTSEDVNLRYHWLLCALIDAPFHFISEFTMYWCLDRNWPSFITDGTYDIRDKVINFLYKDTLHGE